MSVGNYIDGNLKWSKEWNKEGKLKLEATWHNSRWQGNIKRYGPNEELIFEGGYENGVKEGRGVEFWDLVTAKGIVGLKKMEAKYRKGKLFGEGIKIYNEKGVPKFDGTFIEDKKEGLGTVYHKNGIKEFTANFKHN